MSVKLFVYGTLRRNEHANDLLGADAAFLNSAETLPNYSLFQIDCYPGLVEGGHTSVQGELWSISESEWPRLDEYEGVPEDYKREVIKLTDGSEAYAYIFIGDLGSAVQIDSGDWMTR